MDLHRKMRLAHLIATRFNGERASFMAVTGLSKGRVTQLLHPDEPFGERAARSLIQKIGLPAGYFDATYSEWPFTVAKEMFDQLSKDERAQLDAIISAFVQNAAPGKKKDSNGAAA